jgi:hypothetical protein
MRTTLAILFLSAAAITQDKKPPPEPVAGVDEVKVQQAIERGIKFLKASNKSPDFHNGYKNSDVLLLWTFIHAGVPESDPMFKRLFDGCMSEALEKTYKVSLLAMCLEELDRVKYQEKIAHCAQFLVDNQCKNGQWNYGSPTEHIKDVKVPPPPQASGKPRPIDKDNKPKVVQAVAVKKMKEGPDEGDNSNSQYAALGLRACFDAGISLPEGVIVLAVKWWRESQFADRKKDKDGKDVKPPPVPSGISGKIEGWNYKAESNDERGPYHAMTAGGVGALVIYDYMLGREWKKGDSYVKAGLNWLVQHYTIAPWNTYYMYGLERAAILYGTETLGDKVWYKEGANAILKVQNEDGSWGKDTEWFNTCWDTCFSILFLRRATRPLVATEGGGKLKK